MQKQPIQSPDIIFVQKYYRYFKNGYKESSNYSASWETWVTRGDFYRCTNKNQYESVTSYLSRESACDKTRIEDSEQMDALKAKGYSEEDILSYMGNRPGSTGLFNEKDLTKEDVADIRKELASSKRTIYEAVMSFTPEFSEKYVNSKAQAHQLLCDVMPKYFEQKGLDPKNMKWFAAYHTNTDNRHLHIIFYEDPAKLPDKKPMSLTFDKKDFDKMKEFVAFNRPINHEYEKAREPVLAQLKDASNLPMFYKALEPVREIVREKKQFARCTVEQKTAVLAYKDFIYQNNQGFKVAYDNAIKCINKAQEMIINNYKSNKIEPTKYALGFAENRIQELDYRICNSILKNAKYDLILNDRLTQKLSKEKESMFYDQDLVHHNKVVNNSLKKCESTNPSEYKSWEGLSLWAKQSILGCRDSFVKTMNTASIWNDLLNDRRKAIAEKIRENRENNEFDEELLRERQELERELERY